MSNTWCAGFSRRQPDGFLKEGKLGLIEAKGLVDDMGSRLHSHLADSQWLTVLCSEKHLRKQVEADQIIISPQEEDMLKKKKKNYYKMTNY